MRFTHRWQWGALGSLVLLALWFRPDLPPAYGQGVGIYSRASCTVTNLTAAVSGATWCFEIASRALYVWDGASFVPVTATINGANFVAVGGQTNFGNSIIFPVATGTTQQIALGAQITGQSTGTATNRIAGYFGAQTSDTGTDKPTGLNVVVQQGANAFQVQVIGMELDLNSNKANATLDMSPVQVGYSAVSGGSKIAGIAYAVGGAPQWMEGLSISQNSIANGGYALRYKGDGSHGPFTVDYQSGATANTINFASASYGNNLAMAVASPTGINLQNIRGISASSNIPNNLRGTCTFAGAATCAVTFANNERDANYFVLVGGVVNISAKATTGFTMTATGTNSNAVDWMLVR